MSTRRVSGLLGRRGLIAGATALLGAGVARLSGAKTAEAGHNTNIAYDSQTVMHLDVTNTTAGSSRISSNVSGTAAAVVLNNYPVGISRPDGFLGRTMYTTSNCAGVAGACENATGGVGVMGTAKSTTGTGVYAFSGSVVPSTLAPAGAGLYSSGPNFGAIGIGRTGASAVGVAGTSDAGTGVSATSLTGIGLSASSNSNNAIFARGGGTASAIFADTSAASGSAVFGLAGNNAGVFGQSAGNFAVFGQTSTGTGVCGQATGGGMAGQFFGDVNIAGNLTVTGSFPKSAGVPHPDGSVRRMYCMEGPESAFEDWGRATLSKGQAIVKLDGDFAALVTTDEYSVFPAPEGDCKGLYVAKIGKDAFEVRELAGGTSDVSFSYRILARRKDLVGKTKRLEKITLPAGMKVGGDRGVLADGSLPRAPQAPKVTLPDLRERVVPDFAARDEEMARI